MKESHSILYYYFWNGTHDNDVACGMVWPRMAEQYKRHGRTQWNHNCIANGTDWWPRLVQAKYYAPFQMKLVNKINGVFTVAIQGMKRLQMKRLSWTAQDNTIGNISTHEKWLRSQHPSPPKYCEQYCELFWLWIWVHQWLQRNNVNNSMI